MRVGVFTPLLSQLSLDDVLKKLKSYDIDRVELGTGNYPGSAHCKLSMLDNPAELAEFQGKLKVVKVNTDDNVKTAQEYRISGIPSLLIFKFTTSMARSDLARSRMPRSSMFSSRMKGCWHCRRTARHSS